MNAPDKTEAQWHYQKFMTVYEDKYPQAAQCLSKNIEYLLTFYNFPAAHWRGHPQYQCHRKYFCHHSPAHQLHRRTMHPARYCGNGLQTGHGRPKKLETAQQISLPGEGAGRRDIHQWSINRFGHDTNPKSCLNYLRRFTLILHYPQLLGVAPEVVLMY